MSWRWWSRSFLSLGTSAAVTYRSSFWSECDKVWQLVGPATLPVSLWDGTVWANLTTRCKGPSLSLTSLRQSVLFFFPDCLFLAVKHWTLLKGLISFSFVNGPKSAQANGSLLLVNSTSSGTQWLPLWTFMRKISFFTVKLSILEMSGHFERQSAATRCWAPK